MSLIVTLILSFSSEWMDIQFRLLWNKIHHAVVYKPPTSGIDTVEGE